MQCNRNRPAAHRKKPMSDSHLCSKCQRPVGGSAPHELCPACLLGAMMTEGEVSLAEQTGDETVLDSAPDSAGMPTMATAPNETAGERIGRYKLLQQIGEGGFGTVWMAEQVEPVTRRVALKIIKLGMDTREVIVRFEAERQALAMMDHPNIAKVFDAGATDKGRPFFVMELVKGIPITRFCDEQQFGTRERLVLFGDVCSAINHAHQKGIIHRNIKPSNVMVTLHGDKPVVKVIDFGIAKATQGKLTDKTLFTRFDQFIGTPVYMSPEQAALSGLDIDTRSDIYALGILLYELLTGKPPFDARSLLSAGYEEMRRIIREVEPVKPSSRLSTVAGDERGTIARARQISPDKLSRLVEPDLDWIVMKAIEKDRTRRYETANGLAADIVRFLSDEPVSATPPSAGYKFRKFARRNKAALRVAAAIAAVLVAASAFSLWQAIRATRDRDAKEIARQEAVTEAAKRTQVAKFLADMLEGVGPSVARGRDTTILREILDRTAARLGEDLKGQPAVEAEIRRTLGAVYRRIGDYPKAEEMLRKAISLRRSVSTAANAEVASSLHELALVLHARGDLPGAEAMMREGLAIRQQLFGREHPAFATSLNDIGVVLRDQGDLTGAAAMFSEALDLRKKTLGGAHRDVAATLHNLAVIQDARGDVAGAEKSFREVIELLKKLHGDEYPDVATAIHSLAGTLMNSGNATGAAEKYGEALAMQRKLFPDGHPDIATTLLNMAGLMMEQGDLAGAEPKLREALALQHRLLGLEHPEIASVMILLSRVLKHGGDPAGGEAMCNEAIAMQKKLLGAEHVQIASSLDVLSGFASDRGALEEAETISREALAMFRKLLPPEDPGITACLHNLTGILVGRNKTAEVEILVRDLLAEAGRAPAETIPKFEARFSLLGEALYRAGQPVPAEPLCRELLRSVRARLDPADEAVQNAAVCLASLLTDWAWSESAATDRSKATERAREAETLLRECVAVRTRTLKPESSRLADTRSRLGGSLVAITVLDSTLTGEARKANLDEAERLLLQGQEVLEKGKAAGSPLHHAALSNLVKLYTAWPLPDKTAAWKEKLRDFEKRASP